MSRLSIVDIVSLAKSGFKASEIKELMSIDIPDAPQPEPQPQPETQTQPQPETEAPLLDDPETPAKATGQPAESTEDQKRIAELEKQLADLQKKNQSTDVSGNIPDPQETINDIVRGFM